MNQPETLPPIIPSARPARRWSLALPLSLLALLLAVAAMAGPLWWPWAGVASLATVSISAAAPDKAEQLASLQRQLDSLNNRVTIAAGAIDNSKLATLANDVTELRGQLLALSVGQTNTAAPHQDNKLLNGLQQELADLTNQVTKNNVNHAEQAQLIYYLELRLAATTARPFMAEHARFCNSPNQPAAVADFCTNLLNAATAGVATLPMLTSRFNMMAGSALQKMRLAEAPSWWDRVLAELQGVINIRRVQLDGSTDGPERALFAIQAQLQRGQLDEALVGVRALPMPAQETLREWLADATARQELEQQLSGLAAQLAGTSDGPASAPNHATMPPPFATSPAGNIPVGSVPASMPPSAGQEAR